MNTRSQLLCTLALLGSSTLVTLENPLQAQDDPRRGPSSRGSFAPGRRDPFDPLRSLTPLDRLQYLEQRAFGFESQKVGRGDVQLALLEQGELEAAEKADIVCKVRARVGENSLATTVAWLIDDGATVKKGDLLVRLDDSAAKERVNVLKIAVAQKQALLLEARAELTRQQAHSQAELRAAEAEHKIAFAAQASHTAVEAMEKQKAELKVQQAKLLLDLAKLKGNDAAARIEIQLAQTQLDLAQLELKRQQADLALHKLIHESQVERAQDGAKVAKLRFEQQMAKATTNQAAAEAALMMEQARLAEAEEDVRQCSLTAPSDGVILYNLTPGARSVIAVGEPVREGQRLMYIPKPGRVQLRVKVPETLVSRLQLGQRALVSIPSVQQTLAGKVQSIAPVPSMQDFATSSIRVYPVVILVTETSEMLKPMMPAQVSIMLDEQKNVMRVPAQAVSLRDGVAQCFVKKEDGIHERKVTTGLAGSAHVEIKDGLKEGEEVLVSVRPTPGGFPVPRPDRGP
jgi:RND family efflux transporter MFP subunit